MMFGNMPLQRCKLFLCITIFFFHVVDFLLLFFLNHFLLPLKAQGKPIFAPQISQLVIPRTTILNPVNHSQPDIEHGTVHPLHPL